MPFTIGQAFSPEILSLMRQKQEAEQNRRLDQQRLNLSAQQAAQEQAIARQEMNLRRDQFGLDARAADSREEALHRSMAQDDERLRIAQGDQAFGQEMDLSKLGLAQGADARESEQHLQSTRLADEENKRKEAALDLQFGENSRQMELHRQKIDKVIPAELQAMDLRAKADVADAETRSKIAGVRETTAQVAVDRERRLSEMGSVTAATNRLKQKINLANGYSSAGQYTKAREALDDIAQDLETLEAAPAGNLVNALAKTPDGQAILKAYEALNAQSGGGGRQFNSPKTAGDVMNSFREQMRLYKTPPIPGGR